MIRQMEKRDKPVIMEIISETGMFSEDESAVAEELIDQALNIPGQKDYYCIVHTNNDVPNGYLCYGPTDCTVGTYDLYWMAVKPGLQGRGIGRAMLTWLEKHIKIKNGRMIIIETSSTPKYEKTRRFYLKAGYSETARIPDFYLPGDDRILYVKRFDQ